jgi:large subunit ribosomal protein L13
VKTITPKVDEKDRKWFLIDADGKVLGRLASEVAQLLRGKHKTTYTPHLDLGDHVIIINAEKIRVTGRKAQQKIYYRHSGYPGGLKSKSYEEMSKENSGWIIEHAIKGMLPHNRLGRKMIKKLRIYAGEEHPHHSQKPEEYQIN